MLGRNIDFAAVLSITLVMLGLAWVRSLHWTDTLDSIRVENAIRIERCPLPRDILSNLSCILHR
jgi:hypothetical protein